MTYYADRCNRFICFHKLLVVCKVHWICEWFFLDCWDLSHPQIIFFKWENLYLIRCLPLFCPISTPRGAVWHEKSEHSNVSHGNCFNGNYCKYLCWWIPITCIYNKKYLCANSEMYLYKSQNAIVKHSVSIYEFWDWSNSITILNWHSKQTLCSGSNARSNEWLSEWVKTLLWTHTGPNPTWNSL